MDNHAKKYDSIARRIKSLIAQGYSVSEVASELGVSHGKLHTLKQKSDEIREAFEAGHELAISNGIKPAGIHRPDTMAGRAPETPRTMNSEGKLDYALKIYARTGRITKSLKKVGIGPDAHRARLKRDPEYAQRFADARQAWLEKLEGIAFARAKEKSDRLLVKLLEGAAPEKYRSSVNRNEHTGPGGGPMETTVKIVMERSPEHTALPESTHSNSDDRDCEQHE